MKLNLLLLLLVCVHSQAVERKCKEGWTQVNEHCYRGRSNKVTYNEAKQFCEEAASSLLNWNDTKSDLSIFNLKDHSSPNLFWVDKNENQSGSKCFAIQVQDGELVNTNSLPCERKLHVICYYSLNNCEDEKCRSRQKRYIHRYFTNDRFTTPRPFFRDLSYGNIFFHPGFTKFPRNHPFFNPIMPTAPNGDWIIRKNKPNFLKKNPKLSDDEQETTTYRNHFARTYFANRLSTRFANSTAETISDKLVIQNDSLLISTSQQQSNLTENSLLDVTQNVESTVIPLVSTPSTVSTPKESSPPTEIMKPKEYKATCLEKDDFQFMESCYRFEYKVEKSWTDANDRCKEIPNGHLIAISDRYEFDAISHFINSTSKAEREFWVGFYIENSFMKTLNHPINADSVSAKIRKSTNGIENAHWINRQPITFPNWWKLSLNTSNGYCGFSKVGLKKTNLWPLKNCVEKLPYVCEYKANVQREPDTRDCYYKGWMYYNGACYKFQGDDVRTWSDAEDTCITYGGHLMNIDSVHKQEYIRIHLKRSGPYMRFWIGYFLDQHDNIIWTDGGNSTYQQHDITTVIKPNANQYCGAANHHTFSTSNHTCDAYLPFICQRKPEPLRIDIQSPEEEPDEYCDDDGKKSWLKFGNYCYKIVPAPSNTTKSGSWDISHARIMCLKEDAPLAYIESHEENYFLASKVWNLHSKTEGLWIGALYDRSQGSFYWNVGSKVVMNYTNWNFGEPNNILNMEFCVVLYPHASAYWNDEHCSNNYGYICKKTIKGQKFALSKENRKMIGTCPKNWYKMGDKCIQFNYYAKSTMTEANLECEKHHELGNLVSIHSAKDQAYLDTLLASHKQPMWIGLRRIFSSPGNEFGWFDQSPFKNYTNWGLHEPSSTRFEATDCVVMVSTGQFGKWYDEQCDDLYGFICQQPLVISSSSEEEKEALPVNATCPAPYDSFYYFEGNCYVMNTTPQSWEDADITCKKMGSDLVSILNRKELAFIWSHFGIILVDNIWIGLVKETDLDTSVNFVNEVKRFRWSDQWPDIYTNWDKTQIVSNSTAECVTMSLETGLWRRSKCTEKFPFVCKHSQTTFFPPQEHRVEGHCQKRWWNFGNEYCYFLESFSELKSWTSAKEVCRLLDAQMISIHSDHQMKIMEKVSESSEANIWLGLRRNLKGSFDWTDESPFLYANWLIGEPNSYEEGCVEMQSGTGYWNDKRCNWLARAMCQKRKVTLSADSQRLNQNEINNKKSRPNLSTGAIIGINLGIILLLGSVGATIFVVYKWRKKRSGPIYGFDNVIYSSNTEPKNIVLGEDPMTNRNREIECIMSEDEDEDDEEK